MSDSAGGAQQPDLPHPITLDKVAFTAVAVSAIPEWDASKDNPSVIPENTLNVMKMTDEKGLYSAVMRTVLNPKRESTGPYTAVVECVGLFRADMDQLEEKQAHRGVMITAHSVLYGAIRETVAWLTSRQPNGTLMLGLSVLKPTQAISDSTDSSAKAP